MQVLASISYTKLMEIGVGQGMNSRVFLADEPQLGGRVAVKEIEKHRFGNPVSYFDEARAMFRTAHENVVRVHYACQTPRLISLVMPHYHRGSLTDRISDRPLQLSEVLRVAQGVLSGLAQIHQAGYIHFDIKPSNVLFSDTDVPMVSDFGQSRTISPTGVVSVPPLYFSSLPPETILSGIGTLLADVYQTGLLLHRALNGDEFFKSQIPADDSVLRDRIARGRFPDRRRFMPHVPSRLRTIVRKALRLDPIERFQGATEMADVLSRVPLPLDWLPAPLPGGGLRWKSSRPGHASSIVELADQGGGWSARTFTETSGKPRRARGRASNWRNGLSLDDAFEHLDDVFERLGR